MKKFMPVILCSIILFCTACEKAVDPIDKYDNITADSTIEELKEIHKNDNNFEDHDISFICTSKNTVLQSIAEKYNADEPRTTVMVFTEDIGIINVIVTVEASNITEEDFKTLTDMFDNKYKNKCYKKEILSNKATFILDNPNLEINLKNNSEKVTVTYGWGSAIID